MQGSKGRKAEQECEETVKTKCKSAEGMPKKIKALTRMRRCTLSSCIEDEDGKIIVDNMATIKIWSEYIEELFQDDRGNKLEISKT